MGLLSFTVGQRRLSPQAFAALFRSPYACGSPGAVKCKGECCQDQGRIQQVRAFSAFIQFLVRLQV